MAFGHVFMFGLLLDFREKVYESKMKQENYSGEIYF